MNKSTLLQYIKSFNKQHGQYTKEELAKIGSYHRRLKQIDKNWSELATIVGYPNNSGNAYRIFVLNYLRKHPEINEDVNFEIGEYEIPTNTLDKKFNDMYMETIKNRDALTAIKAHLRDEARIQIFKELLQTEINKLQKLEFHNYTYTTKDNTDKEAILLLSDLHIGVECDNFYNKYNSEIAEMRLNKLVGDAVNYCKLNKVEKLNVLNLGDMIHGIIHTSARLEQEMDITKQIMVASELMSRAINKLQEAAPIVTYRSVSDNHSRAIANKNDHIEKENFYRIMDWFIKERLKESEIVFIDDNLDISLGSFVLNNGKHIVYAHGHLDNINQAFQHFTGATKLFVDYALLGHYHCEKAKSYQGCKVIVNGSIVGTEQYALSKRLFSKPSQTLLIFENENLMNISIDLTV